MATDPTGSVVRNLFRLQQLSNRSTKEVRGLIRALFDDIAAEIARTDVTQDQNPTFRRRRAEQLVAEIERLTGRTFEDVRALLRDDLTAIGLQQGEWAESQLRRWIGSAGVVDITTGSVTVEFLSAIVTNDPFRGETLAQWAETQKVSTVRKVRRQVQLGMAQNETIGDIVRRVRGRSNGRGGFRGGVLQATTREAEGIVRTAVNHTANRAHLAVFDANSDITEEYEYVATLDSRTTLICASLDGRRFEFTDPDKKLPPQHFNCRSTITPIIKWKDLGVEPPDEGTRASQDGQVKASTTYQKWLKDQPKSVQDEILGPSRAKLFRSGKADLRDMVRSDGRTVTVEQLREKAA